jgi:arsenate reductase
MKLLFICTHNRCRSILAEAITNFYGNDIVVAKSAGSQPAGVVHPLSLKYLQEYGVSTQNLCSQSWDDHEDWQPDVVITVCDSAANEACPVWFGDSLKVHWGLADPSGLEGDDNEIARAFMATIEVLRKRIEALITFDLSDQSDKTLLDIFNEVEKL